MLYQWCHLCVLIQGLLLKLLLRIPLPLLLFLLIEGLQGQEETAGLDLFPVRLTMLLFLDLLLEDRADWGRAVGGELRQASIYAGWLQWSRDKKQAMLLPVQLTMLEGMVGQNGGGGEVRQQEIGRGRGIGRRIKEQGRRHALASRNSIWKLTLGPPYLPVSLYHCKMHDANCLQVTMILSHFYLFVRLVDISQPLAHIDTSALHARHVPGEGRQGQERVGMGQCRSSE